MPSSIAQAPNQVRDASTLADEKVKNYSSSTWKIATVVVGKQIIVRLKGAANTKSGLSGSLSRLPSYGKLKEASMSGGGLPEASGGYI